MKPRFNEPRIAIKHDVLRIAEILLAALHEDPFYLYLWQHREEFPDDYHFYWSDRVYGDLFNPRYRVLVLELAGGASERVGKSQTIAFAIWERKGHSDNAIKWENERRDQTAANRLFSQSFSFALKLKLAAELFESPLTDAISVLIAELLRQGFPSGRRDVSTARQEACTASLRRADEIFDGISRDRLQMELVCTGPDFQRYGAASKLVQWGMNKAITEEAKIISVAASPCGQILYQKHKFNVLIDTINWPSCLPPVGV